MPRQKPKLLVVDDEPDQCEAIKSYFSRRSFLVLTSASGKEALSLIKAHRPDVVLLDMRLSSAMDGKDVLRALRAYDQATKVIMITGDILNEQEAKEVAGLGIVEFLSKPVSFQILEKVIRKALGARYHNTTDMYKLQRKEVPADISLRQINHELSNITNDISHRCELFLLDTEEGFYNDKTKEEQLDIALGLIRAVLKSTERLQGVITKISGVVKKSPSGTNACKTKGNGGSGR